MQTRPLNPRQLKFLRLYLGKHPHLHGNATACYQAVYNLESERSAQVCASKLLGRPLIKAAIDRAEQSAFKQLNVDAAFVLAENLRMYKRAMGDDSYEHVEVKADPVTGVDVVTVSEQRGYDPATAHKALTSIGQHKDVQAYTQTIEHSHTHYLEQRLAARSKLIEGRAAAAPSSLLEHGDYAQVTIDPSVVEGAQVVAHRNGVGDDSNARMHIDDEAHASHTPVGEVEKRVHRGGGQAIASRGKDVPARDAQRATAK
jgi:phage terminase small subunit